jgi:hypothetical protein
MSYIEILNIGNCAKRHEKLLKLVMEYINLYLYKCGHRNVLSKRQVWMSIFHIINFKKKIHGHRGPGFFFG